MSATNQQVTVEQLSTRLVGHTKKDDDEGVYIGRGRDGASMNDVEPPTRGWIGNPYTLADGYSRKEAVELFEQDLVERVTNDAAFRSALRKLAGEKLDCWCQCRGEAEPACHGEVVVKHALFVENNSDSTDWSR